jgi:hypothetical protein
VAACGVTGWDAVLGFPVPDAVIAATVNLDDFPFLRPPVVKESRFDVLTAKPPGFALIR